METLKKLLARIKLFFGLGTVKVKIDVPDSFTDKDDEIKGSVTLTGKSDQKITNISISMVEEYSRKGNGEQEMHKTFTLGEIEIKKVMEIKQGEEKTVDFKLPFELKKSRNDQMKEKGGVMGALGGLGSLLDNEKSRFYIKATADVEASTFDPSDSVEIRKVKA